MKCLERLFRNSTIPLFRVLMDPKLWASQAFELAKMKWNLQQTPLSNTTELCSHSQPSQDWPRLHLNTRPLVQIATELQKSSQQKQTTEV